MQANRMPRLPRPFTPSSIRVLWLLQAYLIESERKTTMFPRIQRARR